MHHVRSGCVPKQRADCLLVKQTAFRKKEKKMETEASDSHALLGQMIVTLPYQLLGMLLVIQRRSLTLLQQQHRQPSDKTVSIG